MVIGKLLTFAADLNKYLWKQASVADLIAYSKMLKLGKEKKLFASFKWRPVDGKTFVFY